MILEFEVSEGLFLLVLAHGVLFPCGLPGSL